jgi:hypothetical protein
MLRTIIKTLIVLALVADTLLAQYPPSTAQRQPGPAACSKDVEKRITELKGVGEQIVRAIIRKETKTLLRYFHEKGVTMGSDYVLSKKEIEDELRARKGLLYATLFDTLQLRKEWAGAWVLTEETKDIVVTPDMIMSLHDHFRMAKSITIEVERVGNFPGEGYPLWALLSFRWEHRPPKGVYYDPIFICTEKGWKFSTFFNTP